MSICRWSSDNFKCDLYIYEGEEGWVINIASSRYLGDIPELAPIEDVEAFQKSYAAQSKFMETAEKEPINLPQAGGTIIVDSVEDLLGVVTELKGIGYKVPDFVFQAIQEELNDLSNNNANNGE